MNDNVDKSETRLLLPFNTSCFGYYTNGVSPIYYAEKENVFVLAARKQFFRYENIKKKRT